MVDERPLILPDCVLIGGNSRYDFLGWMADLAIQPEWKQKNIWLRYGDKNAVTPDGEDWQVFSYRMLPGLTVLVPPEGVVPKAAAMKPGTQFVIFEEFSFGKDSTKKQWKKLSQAHAVRVVLVDMPIRSGSTDLDADKVDNDAQSQCERYRQEGMDAVCIQPPEKDGTVSAVAVLGESDSLRLQWKRNLRGKLETVSLMLNIMKSGWIFSLDDSAMTKEVLSFEAFQQSGQMSFWRAYALQTEKLLFRNESEFLSKVKKNYEYSELNAILKPPIWDTERDWEALKKKLLEAYRGAMATPKRETEILRKLTETEYRNRSVDTISAFRGALDDYLKNIVPEQIQKYAKTRYEQIKGAMKDEHDF